jgi:MscS family membrane protein
MAHLQRSLVPAFLALALCGGLAAGVQAAADERHPLDPPDLSSPRALLASFCDRTDRLYATFQREEPAANRVMALRRAITGILACLDLRAVAPSIQDSKGREAAVCLKEVLDRIDLPPGGEIPDAQAVEEEKLVRWRLPHTEIVLICLPDGPRAGEWVFSGDTVERAEEFFRRIEDRPYRADAGSPGFHAFYVHAAGWMIPRAWIQSLPSWARADFLGEAVWRWLALGVLFAAGSLVVGGLFRWAAQAGRRGGLLAHTLACAAPVSLALASLAADFLLTYQLRFTGQPLFFLKAGLRVTAFTGGILFVLAVLQRLADFVIYARGFRPGTIGAQLVRLGFKVLTVVAVAWMVIEGADYLGISVAPLLAGFGVGGLAVALAAQHTFENVIAGVMLFADAPVRIGDFCQFGDLRGTVEQIGLRSTRIRSFDRTVISIPNSEFAKLKLVNFSRRDRILFKAPISLRYETTGDQMRFVLAALRDMLKTHPRLVPESVRARFIGYGDWSLNIELYALAETSDHAEFLAIQEDVLLRVMDVVQESGCGFAFPSQTFYQATDTAPDAARAQEVAAQVAAWRRHDGLRAVGFLDTRPNAAESQVCPLHPGGRPNASKAA